MELTTDYYAYEYSIIQKLNGIFNIENIELNKVTDGLYGYSHDEYGNLQYGMLSKYDVDNYIQFNFKYDFHYCISREILIKDFEEKCTADEVVERLKKLIEKEWLKLIYND